MLASLNHPNIAAIYGLEEGPAEAGPYVREGVGAGFSRPMQALVLELVEGPTLADRIGQGPVPLDEALPIARQIADALEAAHDHGVVHRDLKPANIKLRPDGAVKVLDFGLAKALGPAEAGPYVQQAVGAGFSRPDTMSPTITTPAGTRIGMILGTAPKYASGHLLFLRDTTLMAQPFDADRLELTGEAVPLAEQIQVGGSTGSNGAFSVSQTGVLVYQTGSAEDIRSQLTWYDRSGKQVGTLGEPADQMSVELSPDGTRVLASLLDPVRRARDLWIYDVRRNLRTRFTFDAADERTGAWSPDGSQVVFNSRRKSRFDLYQKASSGTGAEELLVSDDQDKFPYSWSEDRRVVAYGNLASSGGPTGANLWTVPMMGDRKREVFLQTEFTERWPHFSPDGRWLAYASNESGRFEVYVTPFPDRSGKWQVSTAV